MKINNYIDYSILKPEMTVDEVRSALQKGIDEKYVAVSVRPCDIEMTVEMCKGTDTIPGCTLDFPHGIGGKEAKAALAEIYTKKGIKEIDMVMNYSFALSGQWDRVADEIKGVVEKSHANGAVVKVIFETGYLSKEQIEKATEVCVECNADYIKTCTGFAKPVTQEVVATMVDSANGRIKVKISGPGIFDIDTAEKYVNMGAVRIGLGYMLADKIYAESLGIKLSDNQKNR